MKITIHQTLKRPWGYETPYTLEDDDGEVYNGYLPNRKIVEKDVITAVEDFKAKRDYVEKVTIEELDARKAELQSEIDDIERQKAEISKDTNKVVN